MDGWEDRQTDGWIFCPQRSHLHSTIGGTIHVPQSACLALGHWLLGVQFPDALAILKLRKAKHDLAHTLHKNCNHRHNAYHAAGIANCYEQRGRMCI